MVVHRESISGQCDQALRLIAGISTAGSIYRQYVQVAQRKLSMDGGITEISHCILQQMAGPPSLILHSESPDIYMCIYIDRERERDVYRYIQVWQKLNNHGQF